MSKPKVSGIVTIEVDDVVMRVDLSKAETFTFTAGRGVTDPDQPCYPTLLGDYHFGINAKGFREEDAPRWDCRSVCDFRECFTRDACQRNAQCIAPECRTAA